MPIIILGENNEIGKLIHLDLDLDKLAGIQNECENLSKTISNQLESMDEQQQIQDDDYVDLYQQLKCGYRDLRNLIEIIERTKHTCNTIRKG